MAKRNCRICFAECYEDEPGSYCQDCAALCVRLASAEDHNSAAYLAVKSSPERLARIEAHARRVAEELRRLKEA